MSLNTVFNFILDMINNIIAMLLTPIDLLLSPIIPNYADISTNVLNFLNYFLDNFKFVLGWINIPTGALSLITAYITFRITIFFGGITYRLFVRWFNVLKL